MARSAQRGTDEHGGAEHELAFYRALCETFPDGLLISDEQGRIVRVNHRLEEMSGYSREELLGEPVEILVPEGSRGRHARERERFTAAGGVRHMGTGLPIWLRRKDGDEVPVDVALVPFETPDGSLTVAAVREDTARRRAEELLRRSEERYRLLVERSPAITHISRLDATSSTIYISPQVERILGYAPHEWETDPELWVRILHPEDRDRALAANERLVARGEPFDLDYRMLARDGRVVWVHEESDVVRDEDGRPVYAQGVMFDVTEAKEAEEAQRTHLRQLAAIAELSRMAVGGRPLQAVLDRAAELTAGILEVPLVDVFEVDEEGRALVLRAGVGWRDGLVGALKIPLDSGAPAAIAAARDEPFVYRDLASDAGPEGSSLPVEHGAVSGILTAVRGRRVLGVLGAHATVPRAFPPYATDLLRSIAGVLAQAMERDEADRLLRERERRLAEAQAIAHLGSWEWDPQTDRSEWSDEVFRIFGLDPEAGPLSYGAFLGMIHEEDRDRVEAEIRTAIEVGGSYAVDYRIRRPDGGERFVREQGRVDAPDRPARRVVGTVLDVTDLRRAEQELAASLERLRRTDAERRRLLGHLIRAREEERSRIAADIHDDPLQKVAALKLRVGLLRELASSPRQVEQIDVVEATIGQVIASLRNLLFDLRPRTLDRDGLAATLRELLHRIRDETSLTSVVHDEMEAEPPPESRVVCYRIAQEAIANVRKHARASFVEIHLRSEGSGTRVRIRDDGRGFDPERISLRPGHLGLPDMRERAELAGGWLRVTSAPGAGTVVEYWIPSWGT